ncbi:MAG: ROK family protein [Clostridia bacterium]|nr:ROK family protein [Clostridia bacterium]
MKASNSKSNKIQNRNVILKMIALNAPVSRVSLSVMSGLSKMSLTNIINEFIDEGIVVETGIDNSSSGKRKPILLELADGALCSVGIHITRSYVDGCIVDIKGTILYSIRKELSNDITKDKLCEIILNLVESLCVMSPKKILGVGISAVGPIDLEKGMILNPTNFYGIKNLEIVKLIKDYYPELPVFLNKNTNCAVLAEKYYGYGKRCDNFAYVGVSKGVGFGVVTNDQLVIGDKGLACEIGHISVDLNGPLCSCGNHGCLELYSSLLAAISWGEEAVASGEKTSLVSPVSYYEIVKAARNDDKVANDILDKQCKYLAVGIVNVVNAFNPSKVIIGNDIAIGGDIIIERLKKFVGNTPIATKDKPIDILLSKFYDKAPLLGGAAFVFENLYFTEQ